MRAIRILTAVAVVALLSACSSAQQAQIHQNVQTFQSNVNADVNSALPTIQTLTCLNAKGAVIAAPALQATGNKNAAAADSGAANMAVQIACPPGSVPARAPEK